MRRPLLAAVAALTLVSGCKKETQPGPLSPGEQATRSTDPGMHGDGPAKPAAEPKPADNKGKSIKVGLVTDVGGRGDDSFNDSALRGLESWAAGKRYEPGGYSELADAVRKETLPGELSGLPVLGVEPVVVQSKEQSDYEPNLQLLVDDGAQLTTAIGFLLENAVERVARKNPTAKFLLVDSVLLDDANKPITLPNVATVSFREHEGSYLAGVLAALASQSGKVGFVGGMELALIKKFEAGFKAGVRAARPNVQVITAYTGTFDDPGAGKRVGVDLLGKGADIVFHAAGRDGLGVITAAKEARAAGKAVYAIGVDSDQWKLAPDAVLTSMVKRVDLAVYRTSEAVKNGAFKSGDLTWGVAENGVVLAPIRVALAGKEAIEAKVEAARKAIADGSLKVPATLAELDATKPPAP